MLASDQDEELVFDAVDGVFLVSDMTNALVAGFDGQALFHGLDLAGADVGDDGTTLISASENCNGTCEGGECSYVCTGESYCNVDCAGGGCGMTCSGPTDCTISCTGGDCSFTCSGGADCQGTCPDENCTGNGFGG